MLKDGVSGVALMWIHKVEGEHMRSWVSIGEKRRRKAIKSGSAGIRDSCKH